MARPGLDKSEVRKACELLVAQGQYPSVDAVRIALGNTGSKTTIHKYLKELEKESGRADQHQANTVKTIQGIVEELAAQLHAQADARIGQMQAAHEAALQRQAQEMALMREQIAALSVQLHQVDAIARNAEAGREEHAETFHAASDTLSGFGTFGTMINNNRSGKQRWSMFDLLFDSRCAVHVDTPVSKSGYEDFSPA